ncbi:pectinesterase inhibitor-like [Cicer arietinum]|uniref:pectinesterase inhibitor-like n=1 Tax=Cicer arietinum TaxID=3827 RepID=UPI00032A713A
MAIVPSFVKPYFLVLALFLCFVPSFCLDRIVRESDICSKHANAWNCKIILNTIPGVSTDGADLNSLSLYLISSANVNAFDTITYISNLIKNTTDSQLIQRYASCSIDYNNVLLTLTHAKDSYKAGNFRDMNNDGWTIVTKVKDCDYKAPDASSPLNNQYLEDVAIIIMILADFLAGKYFVI